MNRFRSSSAILFLVLGLAVAVGLALGLGTRLGEERDFAAGGAAADKPHNCRLWGSIASVIPVDLIEDHLLELPRAMRQISSYNRDGWGIVYFPAGASGPVVKRGEKAAYLDPGFDAAAERAALARPNICLAHVRSCSSGLCDIPNPHPFERVKAGRHWYLAHNGSIDKELLLDLIRPEYLASNPPHIGEDPGEWIDSELYFLYLLQTCEDMAWAIKPAMGQAIQTLRRLVPDGEEQFNILFCDSRAIYAYREGISLYYLHRPEGRIAVSAVASQYPSLGQEDWVGLSDGELLTLTAAAPPLVEDIASYFPRSLAAGQPAPLPPARSAAGAALSASPNPFNPKTRIRFTLSAAESVNLSVFDIRGRRLAVLATGHLAAGRHAVTWSGRDDRGGELGSGVYLLRLTTPAGAQTLRLVMIE